MQVCTLGEKNLETFDTIQILISKLNTLVIMEKGCDREMLACLQTQEGVKLAASQTNKNKEIKYSQSETLQLFIHFSVDKQASLSVPTLNPACVTFSPLPKYTLTFFLLPLGFR